MGELALLAQELSDSIAVANRRLHDRFVEAMNGKDVECVMACFLDSPDLMVVLYGNVLRGPAALRRFLTETFIRIRTVHLEIDEVTQWRLGDTVFAVGTATYLFEALDGARTTVKERWTDARQKAVGKWVYVLDQATQISDPNPCR
jgi:ketosteroid isomerase-like protein